MTTAPLRGRTGDLGLLMAEPLRQVATALSTAANRAKQGRDADVDTEELGRLLDQVIEMLCERRGDLLLNLASEAAALHSAVYQHLNGESGSTLRLVKALLSLRSGVALVGQIQERAAKRAA